MCKIIFSMYLLSLVYHFSVKKKLRDLAVNNCKIYSWWKFRKSVQKDQTRPVYSIINIHIEFRSGQSLKFTNVIVFAMAWGERIFILQNGSHRERKSIQCGNFLLSEQKTARCKLLWASVQIHQNWLESTNVHNT